MYFGCAMHMLACLRKCVKCACVFIRREKECPGISFDFSLSASPRSKFVVLCDLLRLNKLLHPRSNPFGFDSIQPNLLNARRCAAHLFVRSLSLSIFLSRSHLVLYSEKKRHRLMAKNNLCINFSPRKYFIYKAKLNGQKVSNACC